MIGVEVGEQDRAQAAVGDARGLEGVSEVSRSGDDLRVSCDGTAKTAVLSTLEDRGAEVRDFETEEASLEDLFVAYTTDGQEVEA